MFTSAMSSIILTAARWAAAQEQADGLGLATVAPVVLGAAADIDDTPAPVAIAGVTTTTTTALAALVGVAILAALLALCALRQPAP